MADQLSAFTQPAYGIVQPKSTAPQSTMTNITPSATSNMSSVSTVTPSQSAALTKFTSSGYSGTSTATTPSTPSITPSMQNELTKTMNTFDPTKLTTRTTSETFKQTPAVEETSKQGNFPVMMTAPRVNRYTSEVPVMTEFQTDISIMPKGTLSSQFPMDFNKMQTVVSPEKDTFGMPLPSSLAPSGSFFLPGYSTKDSSGKDIVNIGYKPEPQRPVVDILGEKSPVDRMNYLIKNPSAFVEIASLTKDAALSSVYSGKTAYNKEYLTGSQTPELIQRAKESTIQSSLIGGYKMYGAPITSIFTKGDKPYSTELLNTLSQGGKQFISGLPGYGTLKSAQVIADMKQVDYQNKLKAVQLENEAKKQVINLVNFKSQHPELDTEGTQLKTNIENHNQAVATQDIQINQYKTDQAKYTSDLNAYEQKLKDLAKSGSATYDAATKNYTINDPSALAQLKTMENDLNTRMNALNTQYDQISVTNSEIEKSKRNLEQKGESYNAIVDKLNQMGAKSNYAISKLGESQQQLETPYKIAMTTNKPFDVARYQAGDILSGVGTIAAETAVLSKLSVFEGLSGELALAGRALPTSSRALGLGSSVITLGLGGISTYSGGKQYSQLYSEMYPQNKLAPYIGAGVGGLKGLLEFGVASDIASEGQLALFKGYQVRDIKGGLVGGGLDVQNPFSGALSSTKPLFSYGETGARGSGDWGVKLFGYARPNYNIAAEEFIPGTGKTLTKSLAPLAQQPTEVPTSGVLQLGKQQTRFMLGDLTPTELQQYEQIYPLVQQAYRSGQKITGDKNIVDINKLDSLKGLSSEEKDLIKKFSLDYAEQTTGTKAVLNAATGSGPKQFMGSLPNEAKGLLSQNLVRAGKVGDIDVDFYGGALSEGEKVTNALNKLGKHKWVFDDTIGKVSWISGKETKTVFNFLGDDIPGAYLQYTPMGTIQKPAEVIKYTTDKGLINVATKSTADSFADKFEAGYGAFYGGSKGSQLIVSPDKLKNIGDLDSFVKVLNEKGIISADTGKVTKLLQVRNPNVDFTTPLVITRPTPLPIVPIGTEATSTTKLFKLFESTPTPRLPSATTPQNVLGGGFSNELMTRKSPFLETPGKVSSSTSSGTTNIMGTIADIEKSYSASSVSKAELPSFSGQSSGGGRSISASISSMMSSSYSPSSSEAPSSQTPSSQSPSSETPSSRSSSASSVSASPSSSSSGSSAYPPGVSMGSVPWPSLGSLGGQEGREGPRGSMSRGVSEHFLRNFFFEKAGSTSTPTKKIPIGNDLKFNLKITDMMGKTIAKKKGKLTKSTKTITIPSTSNIFKSENINNRFKGKI